MQQICTPNHDWSVRLRLPACIVLVIELVEVRPKWSPPWSHLQIKLCRGNVPVLNTTLSLSLPRYLNNRIVVVSSGNKLNASAGLATN